MEPLSREITCVGLVAVVTLVAVQCTSPDSSIAHPTAVESVELTYVSLYYGTPPSGGVEQVLIDQFEADHPSVEVLHSSLTLDGLDTSLEEYLTTSPPDVIAVPIDYSVYSAIDRGLILDTSDIWVESELDDAYPANFRTLVEYGGRRYFLPAAYAWTAVYYNQQIFHQYGLEPPDTWDEFLAVSDTLLAYDIVPISLGWYDLIGATWWIDYLDMRLNGPEFHARFVQGEVPYDDPRVREVFETWKYLSDNGYFEEGAKTLRLTESLNLVHEGKAAMVLCDSASVGDLPQSFRQELDFFPFPTIDPDVPVGEVVLMSGYIVPASAPHRAEAVEFLDYLGSVETQTVTAQQYGQEAGVLPVHRGVETRDFAPAAKQGLALIQGADHVGQPYISSFVPEKLGEMAWVGISQFLRDTEELESALDALEEARQAAFEG